MRDSSSSRSRPASFLRPDVIQPTELPAAAEPATQVKSPRLPDAPDTASGTAQAAAPAGSRDRPLRRGSALPAQTSKAAVSDAKSPLQTDWLLAADTPVAGKLDRRSPEGRSEGVRYGNGTAESEVAVENEVALARGPSTR